MGQLNNNRPVLATTPGALYGSSSGNAATPFQVSQMTPTVMQGIQPSLPPVPTSGNSMPPLQSALMPAQAPAAPAQTPQQNLYATGFRGR